MPKLNEQTAGLERITLYAPSSSIGTTNGLHPEDDPLEDDAFYTIRQPTSVRRYTTIPPAPVETRTVLRVTHHQAPIQRASRQTKESTPTRQPTTRPPVLQTPQRTRWHWLTYVGIGMVAMLGIWLSLSCLLQWWQGEQDAMHYGYPRTFQIDQDVKHGGTSHFIVMNLHGHIIITEMLTNDLQKTKVYTGPVFSGVGTDLQPATISFQDVNGDGYPDMIISVGTGRYILINDHTGFRPTTPADKIEGDIQ